MSKKLKNSVVTILKFLFAGSIIYYMISTGKLDLKEIANMADKPFMIVKVVLTIFALYALITVRWYYLLIWQGIPTTFWTVTRINCIGLFFNSFMPGSIGGDLVKAYYVAKENKDYRTKAIVTIIIDRVLGFETLMIVAFIAILFNLDLFTSNLQLKSVGMSITIYILASFVAAAAVFSVRVKNLLVKLGVKKIVEVLPLKNILIDVYNAFHIYAHQKKRILAAMLITVVLDLLNIYMFYTIGMEMGEHNVSFLSYCTIVPIGMLMISLPIAPAGVGVGQAAFNWLIPLFGAVSKTIGSTIITIYQLLTIAVNMCFVTIYLGNKDEVKKVMASVEARNE